MQIEYNQQVAEFREKNYDIIRQILKQEIQERQKYETRISTLENECKEHTTLKEIEVNELKEEIRVSKEKIRYLEDGLKEDGFRKLFNLYEKSMNRLEEKYRFVLCENKALHLQYQQFMMDKDNEGSNSKPMQGVKKRRKFFIDENIKLQEENNRLKRENRLLVKNRTQLEIAMKKMKRMSQTKKKNEHEIDELSSNLSKTHHQYELLKEQFYHLYEKHMKQQESYKNPSEAVQDPQKSKVILPGKRRKIEKLFHALISSFPEEKHQERLNVCELREEVLSLEHEILDLKAREKKWLSRLTTLESCHRKKTRIDR